MTALSMDSDDPDYFADLRFFDLVGIGDLWPNASLEHLSKLPSRRDDYETDMVRRVEQAWRTPLGNLSCEQVRLLLSQNCGLDWLGRPVIEFASRYPTAAITNYPGEVVVLCLQGAERLAAVAWDGFSDWLAGDFSWMEPTFDWDPELLGEARELLRRARTLSAPQ